MRTVVVPQLNANDDSCMIQQFYCKDGEAVQSGDLLATVETSKSAIDIECEVKGYFYPAVKELSDVKTGEIIAFVFESLEEMDRYKESAASSSAVESTAHYKLSNQAQDFADLHRFSHDELASLNKKLIKLSDLEELLALRSDETGNVIHFTKNQKQVSKTVTASYATIPRAFLLLKVYCDEVLVGMKQIGDRLEEIVGFGEVLPVTLASLLDEFPYMYGRIKDEDTFIPAAQVNVGVTIDVGTGLYIPVIKQDSLHSIENVVEVMAEYKFKALRNSFAETDLTDGNITVSLNTSPDVISVLPIILPGQIAMISVGAVMKELALQDGVVIERRYVNLGLAYDHRVINGHYAVDFMTRVKHKLEHFEVSM
ncbi:2-oxo acid dehydrogenase subunit E2 [Paenibacillus sp. sgz500958]|uniref:2-oxo acid dehydrogenase subunit E2 n=1 Tax=Paenibacillus sp. sgz500958 TaxID=3242475 RepID=UPI0036D24546